MQPVIDAYVDHGNVLGHRDRGSESSHVFRNSFRSMNMGHVSVMVHRHNLVVPDSKNLYCKCCLKS